MSVISRIYALGQGGALTPAQVRARNGHLRRAIAEATGWAVIDLDAVPGWAEREIIERESRRQNGGKA